MFSDTIERLHQGVHGALFTARLIIWDFDGSFCDTEPLHFAAYHKAFGQFGHEVNEQEYYRRFTQFPDGVALECEAYGLDLDREEILRLKKQYYAQSIEAGLARPFAGVGEILEICNSAGLSSVIASNSLAAGIGTILDQLGHPYRGVAGVIGPQPGVQKKPAPDLFLAALGLARVAAHQALIIEDTEKGLQAAARAGIAAVCVETAYNSDVEIVSPVLAKITHAELLQAFRKWNGPH